MTKLTVGNYGASETLIAVVIAGGEARAPLKMFWARIITTAQLVTCTTEPCNLRLSHLVYIVFKEKDF